MTLFGCHAIPTTELTHYDKTTVINMKDLSLMFLTWVVSVDPFKENVTQWSALAMMPLLCIGQSTILVYSRLQQCGVVLLY